MRNKGPIIGVALAVVLGVAVLVWLKSGPEVEFDDSDLQITSPKVAAESNAFPLLLKAAEVIDIPPDYEKALSELSRGSNWNADAASELLEWNREAIHLIKEAWRKQSLQVDGPFDMASDYPYLGEWRQLVSLIALEAQDDFRSGKPGAALEGAWSIVKFGDSIQGADVPMLHHMVGLAIQAQGLERIRQFAAHAELSTQELQAFIRRLDHSRLLEHFTNALRFEYQMQARMIDGLVSQGGSNGLVSGVTTSRLILDPTKTKAIQAAQVRRLIAAAPYDFAAGRMMLVGIETNKSTFRLMLGGNPVGEILTSMGATSWERYLVRKSQHAVMLEATRCILALRSCHLRNGHLPPSLLELVPEFLPTLPVDDFDGQPLRYLPERRLIYSVGKDLVDSNGQASTNRLETGDLVFPLGF